MFKLVLLAAAFCIAGSNSLTLLAQAPPSPAVQMVLDQAKKRDVPLPKGDYLLLSVQPMGVVDTTVLYDLEAKQVVLVPGTHSTDPVERRALTPEKVQMVREILAQESVLSLPPSSGKMGLDGTTFVAQMRLGNRFKAIGHWSPTAPGIKLLESLRDRELRGKEATAPRALGSPPR